ncbi:hypothetical protein [Jeotgalibaca porci]|uniref:hypothetical protein n=1 Tax=Jeotgalibaca porci TaxID=1868793 RepID=UPI0035A10DEA
MDGRLLKAKIIINGLQVDQFLEKVNHDEKVLDRNKYYRVLRGEDEFDRKEIQSIATALNLSDEEMLNIFFKEEVS